MPNGPGSHAGNEEPTPRREDEEEEGSEDEWEQVGPRNKTSITRQADFVRTPITDIFGGHIRYEMITARCSFASCSRLLITP